MLRILALSLLVALAAAACSSAGVSTSLATSTTTEPPPASLIDVLEQRNEFSTFLDLARRAGLEGTLLDDGPITILAPTDAAFAAVDSEQLADLASEPETLREALLYHMIADEVPSSVITGPGFATTMSGFNVDLTPTESGILANDASLGAVDIEADNGIIHAVDAVLFIPSVLDVLRQSGTFTTLLGALADEHLELLDSAASITFFATSDVGFAGSDGTRFRQLTSDPEAVDAWFMYHLVDGAVELDELRAAPVVLTMLGVAAPVGERREFTTIADADVVITDVPAANGVIHIVDDLFFPPDPPTDAGEDGAEVEQPDE
jgi:uncharacterized surface protein with fasciclin (FAS1) repeats